MARHVRTILAALLGLIPGITSATSREEAQLARYERFAGDPVDSMPFWRMQGFETLGRDTVLVWTSLNDAWLVTVYPVCPDLEWANALALTSSVNKVSAKFDYVLVRQDRCKIKTIRHVDYKAYRASREQERDEAHPRKEPAAEQ